MTKRNDTTAKAQAKTAAESVKQTVENTGLAAPSTAEVEKARKEGVTDAIKENAKDAFKAADTGLPAGDPPTRQFIGADSHTNMIDGMLALAPDALEAAVDAKADSPLTEDQVANLLALERNGPNRTLQVQILCRRLKVKSPYEVTNGGPAYTNDVTNITTLARPGDE